MNTILTIQDTEKFCDDFITKFFALNYGTVAKSDLQELILFLLDEHSGGSLFEKSDIELETLLHISAARVATIRNEIQLKFKNYEITDKNLLEQIGNLKGSRFKLEDSNIQMVIDSKIARDHLEQRLREICGTTFDYRPNEKIVEFAFDDFITLIKTLLKKCNDKKYSAIQTKIEKLSNENIKNNLQDFGTKLLGEKGAALLSGWTLLKALYQKAE